MILNFVLLAALLIVIYWDQYRISHLWKLIEEQQELIEKQKKLVQMQREIIG